MRQQRPLYDSEIPRLGISYVYTRYMRAAGQGYFIYNAWYRTEFFY